MQDKQQTSCVYVAFLHLSYLFLPSSNNADFLLGKHPVVPNASSCFMVFYASDSHESPVNQVWSFIEICLIQIVGNDS